MRNGTVEKKKKNDTDNKILIISIFVSFRICALTLVFKNKNQKKKKNGLFYITFNCI